MAIAWTLRDPRVTSALIGASSVRQLDENLDAAGNLVFTADELAEIDRHATESRANIWAASSATWSDAAPRGHPSAGGAPRRTTTPPRQAHGATSAREPRR